MHQDSTDDEGHRADDAGDEAQARHVGQPIDVDKFRLELNNVELERDEGAIQPHEQALFLRVNFADGTCGADPLPLENEVLYDGERLVQSTGVRQVGVQDQCFIESLTTGRLRRVKGGAQWAHGREKASVVAEEKRGRSTAAAMDRVGASLETSLATFSLCVQGALTGVAIGSSVLITGYESDADFYTSYMRIANVFRRLYACLGTLALVTELHKLVHERYDQAHMWERIRTRSERTRLILATFFFFVQFIITLFMSPFVATIHNKMSASTDVGTWSDPSMSELGTRLSRWRLMVYLRMLCCVLGWAISCYDVRLQMQKGERARAEVQRELAAKEKLGRALGWLSGRNLHELGKEELGEHIRAHKAALEDTERMLEIRMRTSSGHKSSLYAVDGGVAGTDGSGVGVGAATTAVGNQHELSAET